MVLQVPHTIPEALLSILQQRVIVLILRANFPSFQGITLSLPNSQVAQALGILVIRRPSLQETILLVPMARIQMARTATDCGTVSERARVLSPW